MVTSIKLERNIVLIASWFYPFYKMLIVINDRLSQIILNISTNPT